MHHPLHGEIGSVFQRKTIKERRKKRAKKKKSPRKMIRIKRRRKTKLRLHQQKRHQRNK